jgi:protein-S-isoprenylcysteine O-methyltransferase Ste14
MGKYRAIIASYVGVLVYASVPFIAAGSVRYGLGWLHLLVGLAGTTLVHALCHASGEVAERRLREAGAGEPWDRRLVGAIFLMGLAASVVAGLDSGRLGWSGTVPGFVPVVGVVLMLAGQLLFALARRENAFFSSTVRLQAERGHAVCDSGPYRFVRHPGYLGMLLTQLAFPLVLASWWAYIPTGVGMALLLVRTALEDRFLARGLAGYASFATRVRWRVLPGLF